MARWLALYLITTLAALASPMEDGARKVLAARCWACHGQTALGGLRLDSRAAMIRGGKSGPALVPGDPAASRLFLAVNRTRPEVKPMPPGAPLSSEEVQILEAWIKAGATWTEPVTHWSFLPLPRLNPAQSIDRFLDAALETNKLPPNPPADRRTLIRRLAFDLTGLPPTEAAFAEASADSHPDWLARLGDRLLASQHFGETWGRHWLDVARFGEDDFSGTEIIPYANAWRYRDWVVEAVNRDLPYDRFLMAQLAGDLMHDNWLLPATGLLGAGPWYYGIAQPPQSRADERHDRVDMVTRGMLGVTVACARCHDHKYDPFTARDYYALSGVFASTAYKEYPLVPEAQAEDWKRRKKEIDEAEKTLNKYLDEQGRALSESHANRIADYMLGAPGLQPKVTERWKTYLAKKEEAHPFLDAWFSGAKTKEEADKFQQLMIGIFGEKKAVDDENRKLVEAANKTAPKVTRTVVLPGGYRSEEDFNPGAEIPSKSLDRNRYVAWNRTFGDKSAPLKFDHELTAELMSVEARPRYTELKNKLEALKKELPPQYPYLMGAGEFEPQDLQLNIRGNPERLGEVVPRRFPLVLSDGKPVLFNEGSGRLQLAEIVAHHPLAARVAVNRVWMALFGQGLVRTPSNFGKVGDRPVLPDLLDYLAARFVASGYSLKSLVREIVASGAYQRSSENNVDNMKTDAANGYLWRQNRRRLEAEILRDAMLAATSDLDETVGGESKLLDAGFHRRTLYARTSRFQPDETLSLFDLPSASVTCEQRAVTNVPLQKLFFLNSDTVIQRATALSGRIATTNPEDGIVRAYWILFQRRPTASEMLLGTRFLKNTDAETWRQYAQVLLTSNEFAYVD